MSEIDPEQLGRVDPRAKLDRSIAALLSDLVGETSLLFRTELALLKAELSEKLGRAGQGVAALAAGGLIAFSGWLGLMAAATLGLATVLAPWLAALIVGLAALALGAGLVLFGRSRLSPQSLRHERSLQSLREDEIWLRERLP